MEIVLHLIGTCSDTHSHFDLLDFLLISSSSASVITYVKFKFKNITSYVRKK